MIFNSIQGKIISSIAIILFVTLITVTLISIDNQKNDLLGAAKSTLSINAQMIQKTLTSLMLTGEASVAVMTMNYMKEIPSFQAIEIYKTDGNIAFSDYSTIDTVNKYLKSEDFGKTIRVRNFKIDTKLFKSVIDTNKSYQTPDKEIEKTQHLENFFPISNENSCWECHGTPQETGMIRGIVHLNVSLKNIFEQINIARIILISTLSFTGLLIALFLLLSLREVIVKPLAKIGYAVNKFGEENLDIKVEIKNKDELGDLADKLNEMFIRIKERFQLSKFVSKSTDAMIKRGEAVKSEKKMLTVLFSDIRGFTKFTITNEATFVVDILNKILKAQAEIVELYGGDVDKFIGDELMAIFEDEFKAVRCAYEMIVKVRALIKKFNTSLQIGIGVNTGEVIAGNIGSEKRVEYAVIGDTVNYASRLCDLAKENMIIISESTYEKVKDKITAMKITGQMVKGKAQAVDFYVVQSMKG